MALSRYQSLCLQCHQLFRVALPKGGQMLHARWPPSREMQVRRHAARTSEHSCTKWSLLGHHRLSYEKQLFFSLLFPERCSCLCRTSSITSTARRWPSVMLWLSTALQDVFLQWPCCPCLNSPEKARQTVLWSLAVLLHQLRCELF